MLLQSVRWYLTYALSYRDIEETQTLWKYYYRAVDKHGDTVDFLLSTRRDKKEERTRVIIRQCKYLNNILEQDHRLIKRCPEKINRY